MLNHSLTLTPTALSGTSPFTINFIPSGVPTQNYALLSIDFNFGDGSIESIKRFHKQTQTRNPTFNPDDPGDPRNYNVSHTFYSEVTGFQEFNVVINFIESNTFTGQTITIPVSVIGDSEETFGNNIKLVKTKADKNGNVIQIYEFENTKYISPVLIKRES